MAGKFTRRMYDNCAAEQTLLQSTGPLDLIMDVNKYVNCNNECSRNSSQFHIDPSIMVDIESSLRGIDKLASDCDSSKHPFCSANGCLLTNDNRLPPYSPPYLCDRGKEGDNAVVTSNMKMPQHPGYTLPNPNICRQNVPQHNYQQMAPQRQQNYQQLAPQQSAPQQSAPQQRPRLQYRINHPSGSIPNQIANRYQQSQ